MRAHLLPTIGFGLVVGGVSLCWLLTMGLDHNEDGHLPYISETGMYAPERYIFTFALSAAALLFGLSGYLLFRYMQDRFQDVADYYYGFAHAAGGEDDGRYNRERIVVWGSEKFMLSYLPKANYAALAISLFACFCLMFLAIVDLKDARYYHGSASALFFFLGLMQSLFLTCLTYAIRRVQTHHDRASNIRFYWKVVTLSMCLFCTFPLAVLEGVLIGVARIDLTKEGRHNIGAVNQYLLTMSLLLHFFSYSFDLRSVNLTIHLKFDAVNGIVTLGGRRSSFSESPSTSFFLENDNIASSSTSGPQSFTINGEEDEEEQTAGEEEQGIRFVNKGNAIRAEREMQEIIPVEVLDLPDS